MQLSTVHKRTEQHNIVQYSAILGDVANYIVGAIRYYRYVL